MVPEGTKEAKEFIIETQPSTTYGISFERKRMKEFVKEKEAIKQAILKILGTERYEYCIYSWNYGIELVELFGKPRDYVYAEIERRITEALMQDDRIKKLKDFKLKQKGKAIEVIFTAETNFGSIEIEKEVKWG